MLLNVLYLAKFALCKHDVWVNIVVNSKKEKKKNFQRIVLNCSVAIVTLMSCFCFLPAVCSA